MREGESATLQLQPEVYIHHDRRLSFLEENSVVNFSDHHVLQWSLAFAMTFVAAMEVDHLCRAYPFHAHHVIALLDQYRATDVHRLVARDGIVLGFAVRLSLSLSGYCREADQG